ncbi:hypothetical protein [Paenibacillus sp. CF384]|uniref:hypothetical protein n=1 Tax=Paenibacillus sp. CF384 TaxID=1884382 RepID=UPI00089DA5F0|nr:hypothetical protein [Paenibacillus sp. CF384]SDW08171.1 hypothetical protein SAMN05518855_1001198 [Paenibacillus sp. CF384]
MGRKLTPLEKLQLVRRGVKLPVKRMSDLDLSGSDIKDPKEIAPNSPVLNDLITRHWHKIKPK